MNRRRRIRLAIAAAAVVVFAVVWALSLTIGGAACGNADTVECTPLGWVMLYGWMALALLTAGLVLLAAATWLRVLWRARRGAR
ncbi:MAG TPA: hypothetical protein VGC98_15485 [Thermoleophilaceae bacterium]